MLKGKKLNIITLVLPALLTLSVFYGMVYFYLIPNQYRNLVRQKQIIIKEVIYLGWQMANTHYRDALKGKISMGQAINQASREIHDLRWEGKKKNYFFVINSKGRMLVHPFHPELVNTSVLDLKDARGFPIIRSAIDAAVKQGEGYIEYVWDRPDMPGAVLPKLTFVKAFPPWDWIICSGIYYDDIIKEHDDAKSNMNRVFGATFIIIIFMLGFMITRGGLGAKKQETTKSQLDASEKKFKDIFNNTYQLIGLLDTEGRVVEINNTARDLIRAEPESFLNKPFWETEWWNHDAAMQEKLKGAIAECSKNHVTVRFDAVNKDYKGNQVRIDFTLKPLLGEDETLRGLIAEGRDVTEQRQMEEQMRQSQKMESIGQLAGGMAHDFNNMLGGIMGATEMLKKHVKETKGSRYLDMIIFSAENAAGLIKKLLAFSRKEKVDLVPVDVHSVINGTVSILERTIDRKIKIIQNFRAEVSTILGDDSLLQSAFLNLGINAANAMPEGGTIYFSSRNTVLEEKYCRESPFEIESGEYLEVEIEDSGRGIPVAVQKHIFDPFYTTGEQGKGTGLGLSAVYGTVQQHNGAITLYSELKIGTIIHIFFPLTRKTVLSVKSDEDETIRGSGCILIIDDEAVIRATAEAILEDLGYRVILAENGLEGLSVFQKRHDEIDLVIIDMIMPEMNGSECFFEMKKINTDIKVILASGFSHKEALKEMQDHGLAAIIRKPFRTAQLSRLIASVLQK